MKSDEKAVIRLSTSGFKQILSGDTPEPITSIIKVYSNDCHLCHNLKEYYESVAESYVDERGIHFFVFNINDSPHIKKELGINGVPTILKVLPKANSKPAVTSLADPDNPNKHTWFRVGDIKAFIEKER
tara:strand:+ start:1417 stop:1803 length:387 start_codon:yes stop_codon:yes gene_type:complete